MRIGIASEGVTDQAVIENIICGYFEDDNLDQDIHQLQPRFDNTSQSSSQGGWGNLVNFLRSKDFRDAVLSYNYLVVQIDTDISPRYSFGIPALQVNGPIHPNSYYSEVKNKLIDEINSGEQSFFQNNSDKIIFCICVHSLECWLTPYHCDEGICIYSDCFNTLKDAISSNENRSFGWSSLQKTRDRYLDASDHFLELENITTARSIHFSFDNFINDLDRMPL